MTRGAAIAGAVLLAAAAAWTGAAGAAPPPGVGAPPPRASAPAQRPGAGAPAGDDGLANLWRDLADAIDRAVAERTRRPPVPVAVTWRERKVGSIDLGAPLLALAAADLDADGRAELVALTDRELVVLALPGKGVVARGRAPLGGEPPAIRPRDPVGQLVVDRRGGEVVLWARSSEVADAVGMVWREGGLQVIGRQAGFPLCPGGAAELVPGRNYFDGTTAAWQAGAPPGAPLELPATFFSAGCRSAVDPAGRPLSLSAVVDVDRVLQVRCRGEAGGACGPGPAQDRVYQGVGVAFELADIDSDGHPEVVTTRGGAPGDLDRVTVWSLKGGSVVKAFARDFHAGVAGVAAADVDGDRDLDLVVAVRFAGSTNVSFWTLNA
ncbi:MAG TPA: FG-GAP-like repeat-containing protein [Kofleriaceae bacterium]|nr:FG-GAP-like repeat-containing protein [Kofleriaceae bacterium]